MSYLLEVLGRGLAGRVAETLERNFHRGCGKPLAELKELAEQRPDWPDVQCDLGMAYLRGMQFADAARHLEQACRRKPDYLEARLALAAVCDELGQTERALDNLRIANQTHAGSPPVLFCIGYCLEKLSRAEEAPEYYRDAIAAAGDYLAARERLAAIALLRDDIDEAIAQHEHIRQTGGDDPQVVATLGHLYFRARRYSESIAAFETVIALEPDNWALADDEVEVLVQAGQTRDAMERLYQLIEKQGSFADLHVRLAELLSKAGQDDEATQHFLAALNADPGYLEARISLGTHHLANGRWEEAAEAFHQAAELNDGLLTAYVGRGVAQASAGDWAGAVNTYHLAGAVEPNSTVLLSEVAKLQLKAAVAAEFEAGFEVHEGAPLADADLDHDDLLQVQIDRHADEAARHPEHADARYRYGILLRAEGRLAEAMEQFTEAVRINPVYVAAIIRLGLTQQELGQMDQAIETFQKALELKGEYVDLHYRLALLYTDRHRFPEAVAEMEKAADLAPGSKQIRAALALSLQNMGMTDRVAATWLALSRMHREARQKSS